MLRIGFIGSPLDERGRWARTWRLVDGLLDIGEAGSERLNALESSAFYQRPIT